MLKVIIAGGRDYYNYEQLENRCNHILQHHLPNVEIVSGTARGADQVGEQYAKKHHLGLKLFPADWDTFGKSAGYRRNTEMAEYADGLIAFWDGKSRGTKHIIDLATTAGIEVFIVRY